MVLLALFFACPLSGKAPGAGYEVREIPLLSKLPSRCVITLFEDSDGEMWYGTEDGLCRDNGYSIKVYRPTDAPGAKEGVPHVNCITEPAPGIIWFGGSAGLFSVSKQTRRVEKVAPEHFGKKRVGWLFTTSDGQTWVSTEGEVSLLSSDGSVTDSYPVLWQGHRASAERFFEDNSGNLWLTVRGGGVSRYNRKVNRWEHYPWPFREGAYCMTQDRLTGQLYIGTWLHGIVSFNPEASTQQEMYKVVSLTDKDDEREGAIIAMTQDSPNGFIWAATMRGVAVFRPGDDGMLHHVSDVERRLPTYQMITDLRKASDGNLWIGGYNVPSYVVIPGEEVELLTLDDITRWSGHTASISSFCIDSRDPALIWAFQERHRLYLYDTRTGKAVSNIENFTSTNNNLGSISALVAVPEAQGGGVWAMANSPEAVYHLEERQGKIFVTDRVALTPGQGALKAISVTPAGELYIATDEGLALYRPGAGRPEWVEQGIDISYLSECNEDGEVIGVNDHGAGVYKNGKQNRLYHVTGKPTAACFLKNSAGIWVGDNRGEVYHIYPDLSVKRLSQVSEYNPTGNVESLFADSCGNLWIQTEQRLSHLNLDQRAITHYHANTPNIRIFNFFPNSKAVAPSGMVMFGGAGGLCGFPSCAKPTNLHAHQLKITEIVADGEDVALPSDGEELELGSDCQNLKIEFSAPNHFHADEIVYAYRLKDDPGSEWIQLPPGYNVVHLTNIPAGRHTFEVKQVTWAEDEPREASLVPLTILRNPKVYESPWFYALILLCAATTALYGVRTWNRRKVRIQARRMEEELVQLKFNFFTNITHELRTPLSLILTPLEAMINREENPADRRELEGIRNNARELLSLINRILNFRRLEMGGEKLVPVRGDLVEFLSRVVESFNPMAAQKGIRFSFTPKCASIMTDFDGEKLKIILNNLLSNAFKFTPKGGAVHLTVDEQFTPKGAFAVIKLSDTGVGISQNHLPHVLDAFYQVGKTVTDDGTAGSGIGLYVAKEYVRLHGGEINISSRENIGTEITVTLPLGTASAPIPVEESSETPDEALDMSEMKSDRRTVLIAEDNTDFRSFLRRELSAIYNVIEAADGQEGLVKVKNYHPDVIVSDVMMPRCDGFEFCRNVKTDPEICDIPVILLTARIDEQSRMKGFENKADSYITKPFSLDMLLNRIEHLHESRTRLQESFRQEPDASTEKLKLNPLDQELLQKVIDCVNANISNSDYSIADLSSDVAMSRMNLYRKILALTGQPPTEFVKTLRLKKAVALLREGRMTVAEIADATGFSTPSYFTRIFKAEYGTTPTHFMEKPGK